MSESAGRARESTGEPTGLRPPRARRLAEAWNDRPVEWFTGELVLRDLETVSAEDAFAARLIMARFLAAQYFANLLRASWPTQLLRVQRSAALNALGAGLVLDPELRALRAALESCRDEWRRQALPLLLRCAAAARSRSHGGGALALYLVCYEAAIAGRWWAEAGAAARGIAESDRPAAESAVRRRWHRRATAMARAASRTAGGP